MDYVKTVADEYKPWRRDISWFAVAIQAALAIAIGAYFLIAPDSANSTIRFLLAALLIVGSVLDIKTGLNAFAAGGGHPGTPFLLVRGGAGITMGICYFAATRYNFVSESDARYVLGFGMIAFALIGFIAFTMSALSGQIYWAQALANLLFLLLGGVLIYNRRQGVTDSSAVEYLGIAAIIGGLCLAFYAWYLRNAQMNAPEPAPAAYPDAPLVPATPLVPAAGEEVIVAAESVGSDAAAAVDAAADALGGAVDSVKSEGTA